MEEDPKERFSNRAAYYAKYRPRYPPAMLSFMEKELGLSQGSVIADIGSGTGILSELFLTHGNIVFAIESNKEMRRTAEEHLSSYSCFGSVNGTAEETTLNSASVDFVTAAQAFHWFDPVKARLEFSRILKPIGWTILIWNIRRTSTSFTQAYDQLVSEYANRPYSRQVTHDKIGPAGLKSFFGKYVAKEFDNSQALDFEGLAGRLLSSSYVPLAGEPRYNQMLDELRNIFNSNQEGGLVHLEYDTEVYCGHLSQ